MSEENKERYCDFCCDSQKNVGLIVYGPKAGICAECAELAKGIADKHNTKNVRES